MVVCAKGQTDIKPHPTILLRAMKRLGAGKDSTLYIGDMVIDVMAGKNAGVKTVAVTGGSSSKQELRKAKPFKVISNIAKLPALAEEVLA
jgi:pyrophosphatase PpaX